jgi:hypothetical protein
MCRALFLEIHFLVKLGPELASHGFGPPRPATYLGRKLRQLLRAKHEQRQTQDQDDLGKADLEHGSPSARSSAVG